MPHPEVSKDLKKTLKKTVKNLNISMRDFNIQNKRDNNYSLPTLVQSIKDNEAKIKHDQIKHDLNIKYKQKRERDKW